MTLKPQDSSSKTAGNKPLKVSMFRGSILTRSLLGKSIKPGYMAANSNPLLPPLPILMRIDNGLPEPKSLRFGTRVGKISLLCTHRLVKDGALIPMQLASDAFAQPNELFVVICLVGCHGKIRYPLKQFQLVAALGILVDLLAAVMNGIAVVVRPLLYPCPPRL